ncbi:hypothetical protein LX36DRAFT_144441 [Colletotrichum falcatum]|nr:hypothetical protein LX36DRAFT_144441 [Colletotrichum falcatum]
MKRLSIARDLFFIPLDQPAKTMKRRRRRKKSPTWIECNTRSNRDQKLWPPYLRSLAGLVKGGPPGPLCPSSLDQLAAYGLGDSLRKQVEKMDKEEKKKKRGRALIGQNMETGERRKTVEELKAWQEWRASSVLPEGRKGDGRGSGQGAGSQKVALDQTEHGGQGKCKKQKEWSFPANQTRQHWNPVREA